MHKTSNNSPNLIEKLFDHSELILESDNDTETDRWGALLGNEVHGVRMNNYVLLFSNMADNSESETRYIFQIEGICHIDNAIAEAKKLHDGYHDYLPVIFIKEDAKNFKNRVRKISHLLDQFYETPEELTPTPPSSILPLITKKSSAQSVPFWAWDNETLYLTQSKRRRVSYFNSADFFDESLSYIFGTLGFYVKTVSLKQTGNDRSFIENIKLTIQNNKISELERQIQSKTSELDHIKKKVHQGEELIMDLHDQIRVLKTQNI